MKNVNRWRWLHCVRYVSVHRVRCRTVFRSYDILAQVFQRIEVEYLPVYHPKGEELTNPALYVETAREPNRLESSRFVNVAATRETFGL